MQGTEPKSTGTLSATANSFSHSIIRAMLVASEDENGDPKRMTQMELSERSGVARSTIAKYSAPGDVGVINPDLTTICRIADALNISPAFLLMRTEDWSHLGQGAMYLTTALNDPKFLSTAIALSNSRCVSADETSIAGLRLANIFGLYNEEGQQPGGHELIDAEIRARKKRTKKGILAMAALPPMGKLNKSALIPLLSFCAILGAHLQ